jgi:hypothetical protein
VKKLTWIDLRKEIETLRDAVGFRWIALRSLDLTQRCLECIKTTNDSFDQPGSCSACMGSGFVFIDKLVKGFRYLSTPGFDFRSEIGILNTETQVYIIEHDKKPKETDFIFELELNEETGTPRQPFSVNRVFKIQNAFPARGDDGRIEFWRCFVEERNLTNKGDNII